MGGVSGQAGLFGTIQDVAAVAEAHKREVERAASLVARLADSPAIPDKRKKRLPPVG